MSFQDVALQHIQEMQRQTQNRFREYNPGIRCKTALTTVFFNGQQNINLNIILPINFPYTPPIISVHPIYKHEKIYSDGTIMYNTLTEATTR